MKTKKAVLDYKMIGLEVQQQDILTKIRDDGGVTIRWVGRSEKRTVAFEQMLSFGEVQLTDESYRARLGRLYMDQEHADMTVDTLIPLKRVYHNPQNDPTLVMHEDKFHKVH